VLLLLMPVIMLVIGVSLLMMASGPVTMRSAGTIRG
jgi:hypothetical protein